MQIRGFLLESGIYPNLNGFKYLIESVEKLVELGMTNLLNEIKNLEYGGGNESVCD